MVLKTPFTNHTLLRKGIKNKHLTPNTLHIKLHSDIYGLVTTSFSGLWRYSHPSFILAPNLLASLVLAPCWEQHYTDLFLAVWLVENQWCCVVPWPETGWSLLLLQRSNCLDPNWALSHAISLCKSHLRSLEHCLHVHKLKSLVAFMRHDMPSNPWSASSIFN